MTEMRERRFAEMRVEVRLRSDEEKRTIGGYAAVFNKRSHDLGGFYEVIERGAFNQSRGHGFPGLVALYNHDNNMLLGTTAARTLRADVDETGLFYEVDLPGARADLFELVQRGDVSKSSFAFRTTAEGDTWEMDDDGRVRRTLTNVKLFDVSPVNQPAYEDSSVGLRSAFVSLARAKDADPTEVENMARANELRRLFKVTSSGAPADRTTLGSAAVAYLLGRKDV